MNSGSMSAHNPIPPMYLPKSYFDYPISMSSQVSGTTNRKYWADFCRAFFYAGTTLHLWNEIPELKSAFLSACCLQEGQTIFLISKYGIESGLTLALKSLIGKRGRITVEEIGTHAVAAFLELDSTFENKLQWNFNYLDSLPDHSLDRVILFGAASHAANWDDFARQIKRVLRDGGKIIIAELPLGGKKFSCAMHMDAHFEGLIGKVLAGMGIEEKELPSVDSEDLTTLFKPLLRWSHAFS